MGCLERVVGEQAGRYLTGVDDGGGPEHRDRGKHKEHKKKML